MKKLLIFFSMAITVLFGFGFLFRYEKPVTNVIIPPIIATPSEEKPPVEIVVEVPQALKTLNETNSKLTGITCDKLQVKVWEGSFSFSFTGYLRYEKKNKFRMTFGTIFGKEVDLGSNDQQFWFWSRRNKDPGLFYAKHEDYYKTRLKTPFNPIWIMSSLGIDVIDTQKSKIVDEVGKSVMVIYQTKNASGTPILVTTFINKNTSKIESILTTNLNGKALVSVEIKEYENELPKWIVYSWLEENMTMELKLENPRMGGVSNPKLWEIPEILPKIDMGVN